MSGEYHGRYSGRIVDVGSPFVGETGSSVDRHYRATSVPLIFAPPNTSYRP